MSDIEKIEEEYEVRYRAREELNKRSIIEQMRTMRAMRIIPLEQEKSQLEHFVGQWAVERPMMEERLTVLRQMDSPQEAVFREDTISRTLAAIAVNDERVKQFTARIENLAKRITIEEA